MSVCRGQKLLLGAFFSHFSTLVFERGSLTEPRGCCLGLIGRAAKPQEPSCLCFSSPGSAGMCCLAGLLNVGHGNESHISMLPWLMTEPPLQPQVPLFFEHIIGHQRIQSDYKPVLSSREVNVFLWLFKFSSGDMKVQFFQHWLQFRFSVGMSRWWPLHGRSNQAAEHSGPMTGPVESIGFQQTSEVDRVAM